MEGEMRAGAIVKQGLVGGMEGGDVLFFVLNHA